MPGKKRRTDQEGLHVKGGEGSVEGKALFALPGTD